MSTLVCFYRSSPNIYHSLDVLLFSSLLIHVIVLYSRLHPPIVENSWLLFWIIHLYLLVYLFAFALSLSCLLPLGIRRYIDKGTNGLLTPCGWRTQTSSSQPCMRDRWVITVTVSHDQVVNASTLVSIRMHTVEHVNMHTAHGWAQRGASEQTRTNRVHMKGSAPITFSMRQPMYVQGKKPNASEAYLLNHEGSRLPYPTNY